MESLGIEPSDTTLKLMTGPTEAPSESSALPCREEVREKLNTLSTEQLRQQVEGNGHRHQSLQREQMLDLLVDVFFLRFGDDHPDSDGKSNELPTTDASGAGDNELEEEAQLQQHGSFDDTHAVGGAVEDDSNDAVMFGQLR